MAGPKPQTTNQIKSNHRSNQTTNQTESEGFYLVAGTPSTLRAREGTAAEHLRLYGADLEALPSSPRTSLGSLFGARPVGYIGGGRQPGLSAM